MADVSDQDPHDGDPRPGDRRVRHWDDYQADRARLNIVSVFDRLGYNLNLDGDINRLADNLRFAEQERKRRERFDSNKVTWIVSTVLVFLGAIATTFAQFIFSRIVGK